MTGDWYDIKFLESATNVRKLVEKSTGRKLNATISREIAACIQQGRMFFEAAEKAPIEIKPLQIYYGVVAFAQAITVAIKGRFDGRREQTLENWRNSSGEWERTFCIITVPANELVGAVHDRMPAIVPIEQHARWLGNDPDPCELLKPFPAELMRLLPQHKRC